MRFDYSRAVPWVRQSGTTDQPELLAMAGPDAVVVRGATLEATDHIHRGTVTVAAGETTDLTLTWFRSHLPTPEHLDVGEALADTRRWWQSWADRIEHEGIHRDEVVRSLLLLRALTNHHDHHRPRPRSPRPRPAARGPGDHPTRAACRRRGHRHRVRGHLPL